MAFKHLLASTLATVVAVAGVGFLSVGASADTEPTPTEPTETTAAPLKTIVERKVIGTTAKGRKIWAYRLGNPKSKKTVLLMATIHGDEKGASKTLRALRDGKPIRGIDLWVIPVLNPDGSAKNSRRNSRKVDLNRNFSTGWKKANYGKTASGPKPFSERETKALRTFILKIKPEFAVSFHQPLNGVDVRTTRNRDWAKRLAKGLKLPTRSLDCGSSCHGTFSMWFLKHQKGAVVTVEMTRKPSKKYLTKTAPDAILKSFRATR